MSEPFDVSGFDAAGGIDHTSLTGGQIALAVMDQVSKEMKIPADRLERWLDTPHPRLRNATPRVFIHRQPLIVLDLAEDELQITV